MDFPRLLVIVEVDREDRVICQAPGCGHSVYKRIHVVRDNERLVVLGSDCYSRLYEHLVSAKAPRYGTASSSRTLTEAERELLVLNTERLVEQFEIEHQQAEHLQSQRAAERERLTRLQEEKFARKLPRSPAPTRRLFYHEWVGKLTPAQREAFNRIRNEERENLRREFGVNPDLPGFAGSINSAARRRFEKQNQDTAE